MVCLEVMKFNVVSFHSDLLILSTAKRPQSSEDSATHCSAVLRTFYFCLKVMSYYSICTICLCLAYPSCLRTGQIGCFT